jgi:ATPase subunit of ABC transporter with duplicated ATPase domains
LKAKRFFAGRAPDRDSGVAARAGRAAGGRVGSSVVAGAAVDQGPAVISLQGLGKHYGGRTLFEGVSLQLNAGARYGLVGANGSGKTTLLKILCGDEHASEGEVVLPKRCRLGVLRQDRFENDEERIVDVAMRGDAEVWAAMRERDALVERAGHSGAGAASPEDGARIAALDDVIVGGDGYTLRARAASILEGLGIPTAQHELPLMTLSGGFKLRVLLAQVLVSRPDVLLLDEPTNHLDILSIRWLEKWLAGSFAGCAVIISHDQRFLENVATHVLDVDYGTITLYPGGWRRFLEEKELRRAQKEAEIENKLEAIEHKRAFVERFGAKNTKARQAQSRMKQIERIEASLEDLPPSSRRAPVLRFDIERPSGKDVLELKGLSKSYGEKTVLKDVSLLVRRGERVAIVGPNGAGKSTLLKVADGDVEAERGTVKWGAEVKVGYFAQDHKEQLTNAADTPESFLTRHSPDTATAFVRKHLGRVLFSGDDVKKSVHALSGGEAARLILAKLIVTRPNVLLLDEPTNHLDLEAIQALVDALKSYEGTLVFVSHDRWFVSELANRVVEVKAAVDAAEGAGIRDFPGSWSDYLEACGDDHLDADAVSLKARRERAAGTGGAPGDPTNGWEEQKRRRGQRASLEKKRDKLLADLERQEARREQIRALWCSEGFYERTPPAEQKKLTDEEATLAAAIDALVAEWERLEADLAAVSSVA